MFLGLSATWAMEVKGYFLLALDTCQKLQITSFTDLNTDNWDCLHQFAGPCGILGCYEGVTIEPLQMESYLDDDGPTQGVCWSH